MPDWMKDLISTGSGIFAARSVAQSAERISEMDRAERERMVAAQNAKSTDTRMVLLIMAGGLLGLMLLLRQTSPAQG